MLSEVQAGESIVVGTFQPEPRSAACLAVFTAALIRDTLRDNSIELLSAACYRVALADLQDWYPSLRELNTDDLAKQPPPLPANVTIDLSNHLPNLMPDSQSPKSSILE